MRDLSHWLQRGAHYISGAGASQATAFQEKPNLETSEFPLETGAQKPALRGIRKAECDAEGRK